MLRIGLDFDGVVHDVTGVKQRYARDAHGLDLGRADVWPPLVHDYLTVAEHAELVRVSHLTPLSGEREAMAGALEAIVRLAREHELFIITARTDEEAHLAREWLRVLGLPLRAVHHTSGASKLSVCRAVGVSLLLDDSPRVTREVSQPDVQAVLFSTPYNDGEELPAEACSVADWPSFVALCEMAAELAPASR
ncbi:MAG: hypothetical protein AB7I38_07805 [Dehalococcoidia bacterium]